MRATLSSAPWAQAGQRAAPALDVVRRDRLQRPVTERREQVCVQRGAVVLQRRRLSFPVLLDEPDPLRRRIGERRTAAHHPGQGPAAHLGEEVTQPRLGHPFREVARRRSAPIGPGRPDPRLHLPPVGESVPRVPHRGRRAPSRRKTEPVGIAGGLLMRQIISRVRNKIGTKCGFRPLRDSPHTWICSHFLMPPVGLEPTTVGLKVRCSTS